MVGRSADFNVSLIDEIISLDEKRRSFNEVEALKGKEISILEIPKLKKVEGRSAAMAEMKRSVKI